MNTYTKLHMTFDCAQHKHTRAQQLPEWLSRKDPFRVQNSCPLCSSIT